MKDSITLLDGYSLIYRTYFAFMRNPLINREGRNVSVVFGFFNSLFNYINRYKPDRFAVILDSKGPTFRHEMYPEYKANREKAPDDLHAQIPIVIEILEKLTIPIFQQEGMEADDIIASIATACSAQQIQCKVITGDKDLLQLVDEFVSIMKPDKGAYLEMNRDSVIEKWGVEPVQILDMLSLIGDKSDNVPGVKGVGEKGALKMLLAHPSLEEIYEHLDELTPAMKKKMEAGKEDAFLSRELITLKTDLDFGPQQIPALNPDREAASEIFLREDVNSLAVGGAAGNAASSMAASRSGAASASVSAGENRELSGPGEIWNREPFTGEAQTLNPDQTKAVSSIDELKSLLKEAAEAKVVALDVETDDIDEMKARPVGLSICFKSDQAAYVPLVAGSQPQLDEAEVKSLFKAFFETPGLKLIGQNFKYDAKVLTRWGAKPPAVYADTMVAAWLLESDINNFGMDFLAERFLHYKTIHFKDIVPKGETFGSLPLEVAAPYAAEDALITYRLWECFEPMLQKSGLDKLFFDLEMPLAELLGEMEMEGIYLDKSLLSFYSKKLEKQLETIQAEIYELCGKEFNINSTKQLQVVLFEERGLKPVKKTKTGFSTDTSVLQVLAEVDPVPTLILRHRSLAKLKSTYTDTLGEMVNEETGRLHTRLVQTGTATGRLSSRDPNLQNIPIKDEEGRMIRRAFQAGEGKIFLSADYSQIELAVLASLSDDPGLCEAFRTGEDIHRRTAALIFDEEPMEVTAEQRRVAKTINFGVMYGMSSFRLSRELSIPMKRAQEFIDAYFATYSGIRRFIDSTVASAQECGYVSTQGGHIRRIQGINSRNKTEQQGARRVAVNTPIQGTAADIMKRAMLTVSTRMKAEGFQANLLLQIHDELLFELPESEKEPLTKLVREEMEKATGLSVPVKITIESGRSWGDFH